jgi:prevent-host-death family protein
VKIAVSDAKAQLLDLVRQAEGGEDVILTRHGLPVARLVAVAPDSTDRLAALQEARGAARPLPDTTAARSQDFLYDGAGLPG